ncbi:MAG: hypothetical protein JNM63_02525 [Spirochaetia bacterium]|nr:hypothetical protein [Spirochaetia bacterium]
MFRDAGTHRFIVLHDIGSKPKRESEYIEHSSYSDFYDTAIESLRLVRASLIYFVELIGRAEYSREDRGVVIEMDVPNHHYVRGEGVTDDD